MQLGTSELTACLELFLLFLDFFLCFFDNLSVSTENMQIHVCHKRAVKHSMYETSKMMCIKTDSNTRVYGV